MSAGFFSILILLGLLLSSVPSLPITLYNSYTHNTLCIMLSHRPDNLGPFTTDQKTKPPGCKNSIRRATRQRQ
ncbi:hypothetical protein BGX38DRAFT_1209036 [Terfezia claveryi]|nr:hypothetical protein BGX38DRAFT_1209036 [Terfezia claveryi]